jgi:hypothetical protein
MLDRDKYLKRDPLNY